MDSGLRTLESSITLTVLNSSSFADLWLCIVHQFIHSLIHSSSKSSCPLLTATKKKDKIVLSRFLPSGVERPHQVINKTIKMEVNAVERMSTQ